MPETRSVALTGHIVGHVSLAVKPSVSRCAVCRDVADGLDATLGRPVCRSCADRLDDNLAKCPDCDAVGLPERIDAHDCPHNAEGSA
ncbi:putative amidophosphoribosyltransferase [Halarchaeum solikamskense]|uniref:hypothetical protein n=1 Tax=Halarchaeum nitratireducens TaxID=489913 RepID=UPI001B3A9671|nr:hypothetical protein [Halarchaeum solikamskense]MBP2251634.1 putative amidophosphoribosyltransferase [Halarchaeum solikamskense]